MSLFAPDEVEWLGRPHVAQVWFGELDLPSGISYLHSGTGRINIGGQEWKGVSSPVGTGAQGRLVSVGVVEEPVFGQAAAVQITLAGVNAEFMASVKQDARDIEGRAAAIYWSAFDQETQQPWPSGLKLMLRHGKMSAPKLRWQGIGLRAVQLTVESIWSSQNFAPGGRWNDADQQRRYTGDLGMQYVGQKVEEKWK